MSKPSMIAMELSREYLENHFSQRYDEVDVVGLATLIVKVFEEGARVTKGAQCLGQALKEVG